MKKNIWFWALAVVAVLYILLFLVYPKLAGQDKLPPPPKAIASPEATVLPRIITLYQKGDGESDLAVFVANELSSSKKVSAQFRSINVLDEPLPCGVIAQVEQATFRTAEDPLGMIARQPRVGHDAFGLKPD